MRTRILGWIAFSVLCSLLVAVPASADAPVWSSNGPYGGRVRALAISPDYPTDRLVLAGADKAGLFRSTDAGATWQSTPGLPVNLTISSIVISPGFGQDRTVFISTAEGGVYKSWDGGEAWNLWSGGLSSATVAQLAISPGYVADQTLIAATDRGVYLTTTAGKVWNAVGPSITALSVAIGSRGGTSLAAFAGTIMGLYASTDGGRIWNATALNSVPVVAIALSPNYANDHTLLAGTLRGAYFSTDGGATWEEPWLVTQTIHSALFSPGYASDHTLFLGTEEGIYVSRDGGETWAATDQVRDTVHTLVAVPDYATHPTLYAGKDRNGVYVSADAGETWAASNSGIASLPFEAVAVSPNFIQDRTVFAGGPSGIWKSTDDGRTWHTTQLNFAEVRAVACSPSYATDGRVYAATNGGVFLSEDRGETWRGVSEGLDVIDVTDLAPGAGAELWIATAGGGVYYSASATGPWEQRSTGLRSLYVTALEWLGTEGGKTYLLAGTWGSGLFVSTNGGSSWTVPTIGPDTPLIRDIASATGYAGQRVSFAGTTAGAFRSVDRGSTWEFTGLLGRDIRGIVPHPAYASRPNLYMGTNLDGVFRSTNGGLTWNPLNEGLANRQIRGLALGATTTDVVLFAATAGGVWRYGSVPESPRYLMRFPLVFRLVPD